MLVKTLQFSQAMSLPQSGTVFPTTGAIACRRAKDFCSLYHALFWAGGNTITVQSGNIAHLGRDFFWCPQQPLYEWNLGDFFPQFEKNFFSQSQKKKKKKKIIFFFLEFSFSHHTHTQATW